MRDHYFTKILSWPGYRVFQHEINEGGQDVAALGAAPAKPATVHLPGRHRLGVDLELPRGSILAGAADPHAVYKQLIQPTKLRLQLAYYRERAFLVDIEILLSIAVKLFRRDWVRGRLKTCGRPVPASAAHDVRPS